MQYQTEVLSHLPDYQTIGLWDNGQ